MKAILKRLLPYLPRIVQERVRTEIKKKRLVEAGDRKARTKVTADEILEKLSTFSLSQDLIIHGSVSNIGKLDCPVPELIRRWLQTIDLEKQTIICPALPYNTTMEEYLSHCSHFDVRSAPNAMGSISNVFMKMEGAVRSVHPTHSCIAIGKDAAFYAHGHETDPTPFGVNSPFRKLTDRGGGILMFGVGLNSVTNFHVYEDMLADSLPFNVYLRKDFQVTCTDAEGRELSVSTKCHDPRQSAIRECERARPFLERAGAIKSQKLGESELSLMDARIFSSTLLQMLVKGNSIYGRTRLTTAQRAAVERCLKELQ